MGTTYVTLARKFSEDDQGFWMRDGLLALWLRLLALHLPEPNNYGEHQATLDIRNHWMLASHGYFGGCIPHRMADACGTDEGRAVVRYAIESLLNALDESTTPLDPNTINLMGFDAIDFVYPVERTNLRDIGHAFLDLLDGKITGRATSTEIMPGSKPYRRIEDS